MQKLQTVNAETLLYEPLEKPSFVVDSLIPTGLSLFCGSQKIGKSWLMLKLCLCVSQGLPLWDMPTMEGDVLYLCLEDTFCRIQDRLFRLTDEASGRLHFAVASCKLSDGLIVQLEDYLKDYPDSRLIVIDTLQKVRTATKDNAYASDYGDISLIKDFADRHSLAVIVVHHIRKQNDSDVFNKVSGRKDVLGMYVGENESAKFWLSILNGLKNRGVEDILIACVDGLSGFPQAIEAVYPQTEIQQCIIHQIRNSTKFVSYKDIKKLSQPKDRTKSAYANGYSVLEPI